MDRPLYSVHLFAGAGGGILADILAGVRPVCAVEIEAYPQRVLKHRFPGLAVWDDVCTFRADNPECAGCIAWLREHRDGLVIAGGFPCQDISSAGKGAGLAGARSGLWREYARIVREIRPGFVFAENSPMLVSRGLGDVLRDLASSGYSAVWRVLAASDVGARHQRERMWIAARRNDLAGGGLNMGLQPFSVNLAPFGSGAHQKHRTPEKSHESKAGELPIVSLAASRHPRATMQPAPPPSEMNRRSPNLAAVAQFPTPTVQDGKNNAAPSQWERHSRALNVEAVRLSFPTARTNNLCGGTGNFDQLQALADAGAISEEERRSMAQGNGGQLNPDWVEWLMGWPVGWTDVSRAVCDWLPLPDDPADLPREDAGFVPRITTRRENRAARIRAIGNGQVPLCAAVAAEEGFAILAAIAPLSQPQTTQT